MYPPICNSCPLWLCFCYSLFYSTLLPDNLCPFWVPTVPFNFTDSYFFPLRAINVYHTWLHLVSSTDKQWLKHQCQAMSFNTSASLLQIVMAIWTLPHDFLLHNYSRSKSRGTYHEHINDVPLPQQCRTQNIFLEVSPLFNYLPALMTIVNNTILRIWKLLKVFQVKTIWSFALKMKYYIFNTL